MIYQGDQYLIPITVTKQGVPITPSDIDGIKIKIGKFLEKYPEGNLIFSEGQWFFPLTQEQSLSFNHSVDVQVQTLIGNEIKGSGVAKVDIGNSIIKDEW